jgi:bacteriochlorophyll 4-vinyl reductase
MTEARIGRVVVAALHEALAHQLPLRIEFYETYLRPMGMRAGTIGAASFTAALSFLRREPGGAYEPVVRQAGALAAEWTFANVPALRRTLWSRFPLGVRRRRALRLTARLVDGTMRGARGRTVGARSSPTLAITGSPFCDLRQHADAPMCGFYTAALRYFFQRLDVPCDVDVVACQASGAARCELAVVPALAPDDLSAHRNQRMLT